MATRPRTRSFAATLAAVALTGALLPAAWGAVPALAASTSATSPGAPAAEVNGTVITYGKFMQRVSLYKFLAPSAVSQLSTPQYESLILQTLIQETLVAQAAARAHVSVARGGYAAQAEKNYGGLVGTSYSTAQAEDQALKANHLTSGEVISYLELELALDAALQKLVKNAPIPASAIRAYYNAHLSQFSAPAAYDLRVIVVQSKAEAQTILNKVVKARGAGFGALAEQDSIDTATAPERGDLGWVTEAQLGQGVNQAVLRMKVGGYALASTPNGWDVLELLATRPAGRQSLTAATVTITKALTSQHFQTSVKGYMSQLSKKATIRVLWKAPTSSSTAGG